MRANADHLRSWIAAGMCILLCLTAHAARWDRSPSQECARVVQLPRTNDVFFGCNAMMCSTYLQLATGGTYRVIDSQHLYVDESDRGTWTQSASGTIAFKTTRTGYSIECGPLEFCFAALHRTELVMRTRDRLVNLLQTTDDRNYKTRRLIRLAGLIDPQGYDRPLLEAAPGVTTVTREQVQQFADTLSAWLTKPRTKKFRWTPYQYREVVFLAGKGGWLGPAQSVKDAISVIERYPDGLPPFIMVQIERAQFERSATRLYPFVAYPAMNLIMAMPPWLRMLVVVYTYVPLVAVPLAMLHALIFIKTRGPCPACGAPAARWRYSGLGLALRCRSCKTWFRVQRRRKWLARLQMLIMVLLFYLWLGSASILLAHWMPVSLLLMGSIIICLEIVQRRWYLRYIFTHLGTEVELVRAKKLWFGIVR